MRFLKKYSVYIINIILVSSLFIIFCYLSKTYPFTTKPFGMSDGLGQFKPMIYEFFTKMKMGMLGTYSFNNGLGNPTIFNYLYYVSSPINFIALLFNSPNLMYFTILLIKLIITSINTTIYAKSKTDNKVAIILASLSYCFCGWFLIYYYYLSFVDIFMMFPLFQYGLEKLLNEGKNKIYVFSLSYMIISNFYLCFPVCIYTIIYFIIYRVLYKQDSFKEKINSFFDISKATIIVFFITFFWLYILTDSYLRMGLRFEDAHFNDYYITFKSLIASLFYGQEDIILENYGETFPNICCNTLILVSLIYYFLNNKISVRERVFSLIALLIVINVFTVYQLDYAMNFFHEIRGLTYRYCFIACFLEIMVFLRNVQDFDPKDKISRRQIIISVLFVFALYTLAKNQFYDLSKLQLIIYLPSILVLLFLYDNNKVFRSILIVLISLESVTIFYFPKLLMSKEDEIINVSLKKKDDKFRAYIGKNNYYCYEHGIEELNIFVNCNMYFNGKVIDILTSMTYSNAIYDLKYFGEDVMFNTSIFHDKRNEFIDMIYNVENRYYLEKIYSVNKDVLKVKIQPNNYASNQDKMIKAMTGEESIFDISTIPLDENNKTNDLYYIGKNYYYFDSYDKKGNKKNSISSNPYILQKKTKYNKEIVYYVYNKDKLKKAYDILKKNQIQYTYYTDSKIEGNINVDKNQLIFTSIPYDTNWDVYLDGKKIKPVKIINSLMGIEAKPGKHKIKLEYKYHFTIPVLVSIISLILYLIGCFDKRRVK